MMTTYDRSLMEKRKAFWENQEPSDRTMIQLDVYEAVGDEDVDEVMAILPDLKGKRVVELAAGVGLVTA